MKKILALLIIVFTFLPSLAEAAKFEIQIPVGSEIARGLVFSALKADAASNKIAVIKDGARSFDLKVGEKITIWLDGELTEVAFTGEFSDIPNYAKFTRKTREHIAK